ncbi:MAG: NADH-quinone oxidoreductase subunit L [Deltaproteobacteria bacterium]|uniref:NADH-quinone oxidoreductase subunit L n=1 Tax=Candidatus Zymogenus saltonus TaxID=2844893 RepID=A0A9D8PLU6_9DELT|nr:NADH-quinone oxidoreductase subunit L [Candidatus Zymogenus saltonus]
MDNVIWIIPLLPLAGFLINGLGGRRLPDWLVSLVGVSLPVASFVLSVWAFLKLLKLGEGAEVTCTLYTWIFSGDFQVSLAFLLDPLSAVMALVVSGVGSAIHLYSVGYMHDDKSFARYFSFLNLFLFSMLVLVLAEDLVLLFLGWEGVGLCSYLLIGFWFDDMEKAKAGKKAFIVNRIGDFGFFIGMALIVLTIGTLNVPGMKEILESNPGVITTGMATAITLFLFVGATGKSAQIPLYVWLPDAMAGPTPVSALIHAATMVTAGVYMIARLNFLYVLAPTTMIIVALIGSLTALYAATIGIAQNDIKKVLAYSTISQLGYMFTAVGVGAFASGIFHLMTHAFFKALLFLGAGSVIHAMSGEQDIRKMGGLREKMPVTFWTFLIATLAISGIPPLAGFFSKDEILWKAFSTHLGGIGVLFWALGLVAAVVTAFYMFRLFFMAFTGESRASEDVKKHIHESPVSMSSVLILLGILSAVGGFIGVPELLGGHNTFERFLEPVLPHLGSRFSEHDAHLWEIVLLALSLVAAATGIFLAYVMYVKKTDIPKNFAKNYKAIYQLVYDKYRIDELYDRVFIRPFFALGRIFSGVVDLWIIDGIVRLVTAMTAGLGRAFNVSQAGDVRVYGRVLLGGLLLILIIVVFGRV